MHILLIFGLFKKSSFLTVSCLCFYFAENKDMVLNLIKMCYRDFPAECTTAANELPPDVAATLQQICSS